MPYNISYKNNNIYYLIFKHILFYLSVMFFIVYQISKPELYYQIQINIINSTIKVVNILQNNIFHIENFASYIEHLDISQTVSIQNKLEEENSFLKNTIINQNKEISRLLSLNKIINLNFDNKNKLEYAICEVRFYFNGYNKTLICSVVGEHNIKIKKNSIVINESGLVGKVIQNYDNDQNKNNIKIQLITDFTFRVPVVTSDSFTRSIAAGYGNDNHMSLMYQTSEHIVNKENVFTASDGNVLIPEIPVGIIEMNEYGNYIIKINNNINNLSFIKIIL